MKTSFFRRSFSVVLSVLCLGAAVSAQQVQQVQSQTRKHEPPPNILILVSDDMGVDMTGAYGEGSNVPKTPVIDSLAQRGVLFRNAWAHPTCSAARAALMTGRYGYRNGIGTIIDNASQVGMPLAEITLPEMLELGAPGRYAAAAIGKWHLGHPDVGGNLAPNLAGFQHFAGALGNFLPPNYDHYFWPKVVDGVAREVTGYSTTVQVDDALEWLADAPEPWLCYLSFSAPHFPFQAPPAGLHTVDLGGASTANPFPFYSAMVESMDTEIGRLFDGLGKQVMKRTDVFFVGDNGTPVPVLQPPLTAGKFSLYEGGLNVPFLVAGPSVRRGGRESAALVHLVDIFGTVAEIAGIDLAGTLPGVALDTLSLYPILRNQPNPPEREVVFSEMFSPNGVGLLPPPPATCPDPHANLCQPDLGFAGPGSATLTVCGQELYGGFSAGLTVTSSIPDGAGALYVSQLFNPTPILGGMLVPFPWSSYFPFVTDSAGVWTSKVIGNTPSTFYYQGVVFSQTVPDLVEFTNAIRVEGLGTNNRAVRNARYKLISNAFTCVDELYDLDVDPYETTNLLEGSLGTGELANYAALLAAIDTHVAN